MASVHPRENKAGKVTSYQVKWRLGGARSAPVQTERFNDETSAKVFKEAVDDCGQEWPPGWVKGRGYITQDAADDKDDARFRFRAYATASIERRTGSGRRYRQGSLGELERYVFPTFANCDIRSTEHFSADTVADWLLRMQKTMVWRGSKHRPMSPKTIKNLHGLLSSILKQATMEEPPLRARNPCERSALPKAAPAAEGDDDDDHDEDMEFLEPSEVEGIVSCLQFPEDKRLVRVAFATGLRWGELTALACRHAQGQDPKRRKIKVTRAWKWDDQRSYYLGEPKTKRSKRTIRVSSATWQDLVDQGADSRGSAKLIFHNGLGTRLPYSTFYDRWVGAVRTAKEFGLLPDYKFPTFHDLRHSHAAVLLSEGRGLTYVQRRLGHESITTTSDRYGHLLPEADDDAMDIIDASLGAGPGDPAEAPAAPETGPERRVHAVHFGEAHGAHLEGFWKRADAELVAERWGQDYQQPTRIETWAQDWWIRQHGNGIKDVRDDIPDRVRIYRLGPATYKPDGSRLRTDEDRDEPAVMWVWEWEELYTSRSAESRLESRPGQETLWQAEAWGTDEVAVREAFTDACARALMVCGQPLPLDSGPPPEHESA